MKFQEFLESVEEIRTIGGQPYVKVKGVWVLKSSIKEKTPSEKSQKELLETLRGIENDIIKVITLVPMGTGESEARIKELQSIQTQIREMTLSIGKLFRKK